MHTIRELKEALSDNQSEQILKLVAHNAESIGTSVVQKESPFYPYISIYEIIRTEAFLRRIEEDEPSKTHLIIAEDSLENIIGYLLYNKDISGTDDVSICSTVVSEEYRCKGIFTEMINLLKSKSQSITLSCFINLVDFYQKYGFKVETQSGSQVGMIFGNCTGSGQVVAVEEKDIDNDPYVRTVLDEIKQKLGPSFDRKLSRLRNDYKREEKKVEEYIKSLKNSEIIDKD